MLTVLDPQVPEQAFPAVETALEEPNGLLAVGGCLTPQRLANAYRQGIFPWFNPGEPILWWSPDPRLILLPEWLKVSRSLGKRLRRSDFQFSFDTVFSEVMAGCAAPRAGAGGTWISADMRAAYAELHRLGMAHSFEAWQDGQLVGGLYGVAMGRVFFGESMFYRVTDASKAAFVFACEQLDRWGYRLIDCQVHTPHLQSFGASEIPRPEFSALLRRHCDESVSACAWTGGEQPL
jgi:leucyl/phenylalanyl-tRNA--protein transferase